MKLNQQMLQINRSFVICFAVSSLASAGIAQLLSGYESHVNTTVTITVGYAVYFAIFSCLFYMDNRQRYGQMERSKIRRELLSMVSSFGVGEMVYLGIRWPTLFYFLEAQTEPFAASLASEIIATLFYMASVTVFLRKTGTFQTITSD